MRSVLAFVMVALFALFVVEMSPQVAYATHTGDHESPTDRDRGGGNDPNSKAPGQTTNPNPGK